jgi:hypothetical protein
MVIPPREPGQRALRAKVVLDGMIAERPKPVNDAPRQWKAAGRQDWARKTTNRMLKAAILRGG